MRLVRSPLRVSIGGGGTDLPFYYKDNKADLTFATINKYIYILSSQRLDRKYHLSLENHEETASDAREISDEYVKAVMETLDIETEGLSISSSSEVPSGTGLGSSGSFTVGLLKSFERYSGKELGPEELAETAFDVERNQLGKICGKQDQYAAALGGLKRLQIDEDGEASTESLDMKRESIKDLEERLMLFYTRKRRYSQGVLDDQKREVESNHSKKMKMDRIKEIGEEISEELEKGNISRYGELLDKHWETKKKFTEKMTNPEIDRMYSAARDKGALGGKIVGAGGGGFLLLYVEKDDQKGVRKVMENYKAKKMEFKFENRGCEVINDR